MLKLPDSISSEQDLSALVVEIRDCLKWLSHEAIKKRSGKTETPSPPQMSPAADELVKEFGASPEKMEQLVAELEKTQKQAKIVTITLAAQPSNSIKQTLVAWCRKEIAADILVNFTYNRAILGGMVVRAGSRVFDWSFRRQILGAGDKFPEVFRRV